MARAVRWALFIALCAVGALWSSPSFAAFTPTTTAWCAVSGGCSFVQGATEAAACAVTLQPPPGTNNWGSSVYIGTQPEGAYRRCYRNRIHDDGSGTVTVANDGYLDIQLVSVAPSCPSGSTLANGECTCTAPNVQTGTGTTATCGAPPPATCPPLFDQTDTGSQRFSLPGGGTTYCYNGCLMTPTYINGTGANAWGQGPMNSMGLPCTNGGTSTPDATPQEPEQNSCPVGTCPTQIPGNTQEYSCILCSVTHNEVPPPGSPASAPGVTSTTVNPDGTVTTETRNPDGSVSSSSSPGQQIGIEGYCTRNPTAFICTGVPGGAQESGSAAPPSGAASGVPGPESAPGPISQGTIPTAPTAATLYTPKYPDGLSGVWESRRSALQSSGLFTLAGGMVPSFGSGGCPTFSIPSASVFGISVGGDLSPPCWVWDLVRAVMMLGALFAARRAIFGA